MSNYIPDGHILCENCYKFFVSYTPLIFEIDADVKEDLMNDVQKGIINRVKCPYCNTEFTYEASVFIFSNCDKFVITSAYPDAFMNVGDFSLAAKISKMDGWRFRRCQFFMDAAEKIRIFRSGLDDAKINLLKLKCFENYKSMELDDQYITFEYIKDNLFFFTHRDFTDRVLKELYVEKCDYDAFEFKPLKTGDWITVDRDWTINYLEENK